MASAVSYLESPAPSFLFDLDGTLIDSVYQHVIAWRTALMRIGIDLSVWRIHRRIGMSGGLFVAALPPETGRALSKEGIHALQQAHPAADRAQAGSGTAPPRARARRAGALGIGLLSGGYGREELERAGAYRVYADPAEMLARIDELGVRAD